MIFDPDNQAFDEDSRPVESVDFDYPAEDNATLDDLRPSPDMRQFIIYILEGGHGESWRTRAATIANILGADGYDTTAKAAHAANVAPPAIRKERSLIATKLSQRRELQNLRAKHRKRRAE